MNDKVSLFRGAVVYCAFGDLKDKTGPAERLTEVIVIDIEDRIDPVNPLYLVASLDKQYIGIAYQPLPHLKMDDRLTYPALETHTHYWSANCDTPEARRTAMNRYSFISN